MKFNQLKNHWTQNHSKKIFLIAFLACIELLRGIFFESFFVDLSRSILDFLLKLIR